MGSKQNKWIRAISSYHSAVALSTLGLREFASYDLRWGALRHSQQPIAQVDFTLTFTVVEGGKGTVPLGQWRVIYQMSGY